MFLFNIFLSDVPSELPTDVPYLTCTETEEVWQRSRIAPQLYESLARSAESGIIFIGSGNQLVKKILPIVLFVLGIIFFGVAYLLRTSDDAHQAITNLTSLFMMVGGGICIVGGGVLYFIRNDDEEW